MNYMDNPSEYGNKLGWQGQIGSEDEQLFQNQNQNQNQSQEPTQNNSVGNPIGFQGQIVVRTMENVTKNNSAGTTKIFYLERGPINPPELHAADEDQLMKVYETNDDAMTDLANMDDNEVFATRDNDYLGAVIVDKVEDGNYNPLTSNAVYNYVKSKPDWSNAVAITAAQLYAGYTAPSDGVFIGSLFKNTSGDSNISINTIDIIVVTGMTSNGFARPSNVTITLNKDDVIKYGGANASEITIQILHFVPFKS